MARPVEQSVASSPLPARTLRRSVPRGADAETIDFQTALRGADQKSRQQEPAVPSEPSRKPDAAKKPAAKSNGKPSRVRKQREQTVSADEQSLAEPDDAPRLDIDAPTTDSIDATAQPLPAADEDGPSEQASVPKTTGDAAQSATIPSAIVTPVPVDAVQSTSLPDEGETGDSDANPATATSPRPLQKMQPARYSTFADDSEIPLNASPVRAPAAAAPASPVAAEIQANLEKDEKPVAETAGGMAIPRELEMVDAGSVDESPDDTQLPKVDLKPQSTVLRQAFVSDVPSQLAHKVVPLTDASPPPASEARFVEANHDKIVSAVRGQLLPDGGQMRIRLDPPELGALWVRVHVQGGVMTASFETSSEQATRALSHSLSQLKHALEAGGVTVDKLQVAQAPRGQEADLQGQRDQQHQQPGSQDFRGGSSQRDQQRQELIQKMWEKIALGRERVDLKA